MVATAEVKDKAKDFVQMVMVKSKTFLDKAQHDLEKVGWLQKLEETTHIPKLGIVAGLVFIVLSLFLSTTGALIVCNLVSFILPAYSSFSTIEKGDPLESKIWLSYWTVISGLNLLDAFSGFITYYLPFYYLLKLGLILYLILPQTRGVVHVKNFIEKWASGAVAKKD